MIVSSSSKFVYSLTLKGYVLNICGNSQIKQSAQLCAVSLDTSMENSRILPARNSSQQACCCVVPELQCAYSLVTDCLAVRR